MAWGIENPSNTGTACVTPSPESSTIPVVRPEEYLLIPTLVNTSRLVHSTTYSDKTACTEVNKAGTLKVSKNIWAATSLLLRGLRGASVSRTGCWCHKKLNTSLYRRTCNAPLRSVCIALPCKPNSIFVPYRPSPLRFRVPWGILSSAIPEILAHVFQWTHHPPEHRPWRGYASVVLRYMLIEMLVNRMCLRWLKCVTMKTHKDGK